MGFETLYQATAAKFCFFVVLTLTPCLLLSTAWRGGELVFRYALGVMSLRKAEEHSSPHHNHKTELAPKGVITKPHEH